MKKAALYAGIIAALICGTTFAAVISGVSAGSGSVYPTPVPAQYVAASYGSGLANESIAAGTDTALYCAMDNLDGTTSTPECGLNAIRHKGVGPFSDADYLSLGTGSDVFDFAGDFHGAIVLRPTSLAAAQYLLANNTGTAGWALYTAAGGTPVLRIDGPGGSQYVVAGTGALVAHNTYVITFGRIGTTGHISVNGAATTTLAVETHAPATGTVMYLGRYVSAGTAATAMGIQELSLSDGTTTAAALAARGTATMACRNAGRCIPTSADEVAYFGGDDYTIGGSWCGDYPTCSATKTFARQGTVTTREARYSWPALTPSQNGTVPRVATSGLHPKGYGARHASLSGWSAGNYLSRAGAWPSVFTACVIADINGSSATQPLMNTSATPDGILLWMRGSFVPQLFYTGGTGNLVGWSSMVQSNQTNFACFGHDGTKMWLGANGTTDNVTVTYVPGTSSVRIGESGGDVAIREVMWTSTPPTDAYLKYLMGAGMSCTTQGNCIPRDANTIVHANADEFTGGMLRGGVGGNWTTNGTVTLNTPDFYRNVDAQRISAPGAGPYSAANFFQWGTTTDVLDFSGSWTVCSSFDVITSGGQVINGGYDAGTLTGWTMNYVSGKLQCVVSTASGGAGTADTDSTAASNGALNLGCCGWDQNTDTIYARLNSSAIATGTNKFAPALTLPSYIGRRNAGGTELGGRVYEILALNKAPTTEVLDTIHRRWLNHQSLTGQPLTNTHTVDTSMYHSAGKTWRRGSNMQRQESSNTRIFTNNTVQGLVVPSGDNLFRTFTPPGFSIYGATVAGQLSVPGTSAYTKGVTFTHNAALAPDGTMTATAVRETAVTGAHEYFMPANKLAANGDVVYAVYIQPIGRPCLAVYNYYANYTSYGGLRAFDTTTDTIVNVGSAGYFMPKNIGAEKLANGWYRIWVGRSQTNASDMQQIKLQARPTCDETWSHAGDVNYGFNYWNPTYETGKVTPGAACTTAPSTWMTCTGETVTVPNPLRTNGTDWTNLLLQSEDLATTWVASVGGGAAVPVVTANAALAPDGSFTADKIVFPASTGGTQYSIVNQTFTATAAPYRPSIYLRTESGSGSVWLEWWNGATVYTKECALTTAWTRCEGAAQTLTAAAWRVALGWDRISGIPAANHPSITVYAWAAQMETPTLAAGARPYCPTTTAARTCGPGGATGKTITNLIPYNENLRGTGWSAGAVTVDAATNADGLHLLTPVGSGNYVQTSPGITTPSTAVVSASAKFQSDAATAVGTLCIYSSGFVSSSGCARESGAACATSSEDGGHSCCASGTFTTAADRISVHCVFGAATTSYFPFVSAGQYPSSNNTIYAGKMQLEPLAASGPYCGPTAAASRTCAPTQRWCVRVKDATPGYGRPWTLTTGTVLAAGGAYNGANSWNVQAYGTKIYLDSRGGDAVAISMNADHTFTDGSTHTIVACANDGVGTIYYDGSFTPAGTGAVATFSNWPTSAFMGSVAAGVYSWDGTIGSLDLNSTGDPRDFVWDRRTP